MNLPFILEVTIGLIFIYLILSLLSSEIQELLTTLLQWRAAHLKKSIEVLLSGSEDNNETIAKSRRILEEIYNNPLIRNISQESRGGIENKLRWLTRRLVTVGRKRNLTLKGHEPSYIPSETFATTLLEKLALSQIAHDLTALKLQVLIERDILVGVQNSLKAYLGQEETQLDDATRSQLKREFNNLRTTFNEIVTAFKSEKISLQTSVYRLKSELNNYILSTTNRIQPQDNSQENAAATGDAVKQQSALNDNPLLWQLGSLQRGVFYDDENAEYDNITEVIRRLQPSLAEILEVFKQDARNVYEQYETFAEAYQGIRDNAQDIARDLPLPVQQSLAALARRAEINLQRTKDQVELLQDELQQFKLEIQNWFDRSMDRASGVYKRNAKGVGFLIGLLLAIALNVDTFHIATRLTSDSTLREALVSSAEVISSRCGLSQPRPIPPAAPPVPPAAPVPPISPPAQVPASPPVDQPAVQLPSPLALPFEQPAFAQATPAPTSPTERSAEDCITEAVQRTTALPLGWNQENLDQQQAEATTSFIPLPLLLRQLLGWTITGLAIAMGASFWFDLLGKVVNVRNAGRRPETKVDTAPPAKSDR